ncbi:ArsR family transcriptional regulator [Paenibacillus pabuli]|uniref:ArsR/SmtB family transcription factor n=1 Tax=Paenibacillus pabuli TaxID=1472 RepID=UPI003242AA48
MEPLLIFKALSNETRRQILSWLKDPEQHFPPLELSQHPDAGKSGICVGTIQMKAGLAQSVISSYLLTMLKAGLLLSERRGQWTYYRRNEETIRQFAEYVQHEL